MKQIPMFLMLLLATAVAEGGQPDQSDRTDAKRKSSADSGARGAECDHEHWSEASLASDRMRKSAA
jgi:hypothetical protein